MLRVTLNAKVSKYSMIVPMSSNPHLPSDVQIYTEPHCLQSWYEVYVDGVMVKSLLMDRGESK